MDMCEKTYRDIKKKNFKSIFWKLRKLIIEETKEELEKKIACLLLGI